MRAKLAAYEAFAAAPNGLNAILAEETKGCYVGPMPVKEFFDKFMPWNEEVPEAYKTRRPSQKRVKALKSVASVGEKESYGKFIEAFTDWPPHNTDFMDFRLELKNSHRYRDKDCRNLGVDISGYGTPFVLRRIPQKMDFANVETWIELKPTKNCDGFLDSRRVPESKRDNEGDVQPELNEEEDIEEEEEEESTEDDEIIEDNRAEGTQLGELDIAMDLDGKPREIEETVSYQPQPAIPVPEPSHAPYFPFENHTKIGCETRAQIASYAGATMSSQFRHHLFTVLVLGNRARLIRWDRAGAIVTASFDYTKRPSFLFDYFRRFAQLTRSQRGIDTNFSPATKANATLARRELQKFATSLWLGRAGDIFKDMVAIETQSFHELKFEGKTFVIPAPHCDDYGLSPFGRGSRARLAVDVTSEVPEVRFMKDSWRDCTSSAPEAEIYRRLHSFNVKFVAEMDCGGDTGANTQGHLYTNEEWVLKASDTRLRVRSLAFHIVVLKTIGRSLTTFRTARQLLTSIADGMEGYEDALARASVMHRDISAGNIMMVRDRTSLIGWKGVLIDWDHCFLVHHPRDVSRIMRTGTWQFLSAYLAAYPDANHTPADDRESALHVLVWIALRHLKHGFNPTKLQLELKAFDFMEQGDDGLPVSDSSKMDKVSLGYRRIKFSLNQLNTLVTELTKGFSARYDPVADPAHPDPALDICKPEWLYQTIRKAAESLPLLEGSDEKDQADWVDNTRDLAELARKRDRNGGTHYPVLPTRAWVGYTRKLHSHIVNPLTELQPSQAGQALEEEEEEEERNPKRIKH